MLNEGELDALELNKSMKLNLIENMIRSIIKILNRSNLNFNIIKHRNLYRMKNERAQDIV